MISNSRRRLFALADRAARAANSRLALPALAAIALAATASFSVPVGPFLTAFSVAAPRRWLAFALTANVATATAAVAVNVALVLWAAPWIGTQIPAIVASPEWQRLSEWMQAHGLLAMIAWLALPLPQAPFMVLGAVLGVHPTAIAIAFLIGKGAKYAGAAYVASHAARFGGRWAQRFRGG